MLESAYQAKLIKRIKRMLPGCQILKNDTEYLQGVPDLTIFYGDRWGMLEVKRSKKDRDNPQPNQEWYIQMFSLMSFASFIFPEIEEEVLYDLQQALSS